MQSVERLGASTRGAKPLHLVAQARCAERALDGEHERVDVERLGDEVVGAGADRGDRGLERAERGDHDDRHVGAVLGDALAELDPVHAAHAQIRDDDIDLTFHHERERFVGGRAVRRDVRLRTQPVDEHATHLDLVVDD